MTAKDELIGWLTRNGVIFTVGVFGDDVHDAGCWFVRVDRVKGPRWDETKNSGYMYFFTEAVFTPDGELIRIGAWE
jgi:hypothetical protein